MSPRTGLARIALLSTLLAGERAALAQAPDNAAERSPRVRDDRPQLAVGADLGFARYERTQGDTDIGLGPAWQARVGAQVVPWLAFDARYFGVRHSAVGALVAHAGSIEARFSIPWRVRPYLSSGVGWYTVTAYDAEGAAVVAPDPAAQVPVSLGAELMLIDRLGLQLEGTYRFLFEGRAPGTGFARTQLLSGTAGARAYF